MKKTTNKQKLEAAKRVRDEYHARFVEEEKRRIRAEKLYYELIYLVGMKHPGETRHETAMRYIVQAENQPSREAQSSGV